MKHCIFLCHQQRGIGLPEVMITLLLLSSVSLVLTQLQLKNLQSAYQSHQDSRQALQQGEAIERLWQHRCYLSTLDDVERSQYLTNSYPDLFGPHIDSPLSPAILWQQYQYLFKGC